MNFKNKLDSILNRRARLNATHREKLLEFMKFIQFVLNVCATRIYKILKSISVNDTMHVLFIITCQDQ